jgi:Na+/proline symporter
MTVYLLSDTLSFGESLHVAKALGKLDVIDLSWKPDHKYTLWSGLIGGFFLQLSYFGTDQSQVQRYLGGETAQEARQGLWMNAALKIPMQFFVLLTGVLVFVFTLFHPGPLHWNEANLEAARRLDATSQTRELEKNHSEAMAEKKRLAEELVGAWRKDDPAQAQASLAGLAELDQHDVELRKRFQKRLAELLPKAEANDKDYIFISFIMDHLPAGIIGFLLAMIFCAGMSSTSSALSALATTSTVDVLRPSKSEAAQVRATQWATVVFGLVSLGFAALFSLFENLIQAVNILGSLFYGTILGIFLVAFFVRHVRGTAVFFAALIAETVILAMHFTGVEVAFLWYNLIAPAIVVVLAIAIQALLPAAPEPAPPSSPQA